MFGLHGFTLLYLGFGVVLVVSAFIVVPKTLGTPVIRLLAAVYPLAGLFLGLLSDMSESYYDTRDGLIAVKLAPADIQMIGTESWWNDDRVVVEKAGCSASYDILPKKALGQLDTWPLVPGTGKVLSGCGATRLDELFVQS